LVCQSKSTKAHYIQNFVYLKHSRNNIWSKAWRKCQMPSLTLLATCRYWKKSMPNGNLPCKDYLKIHLEGLILECFCREHCALTSTLQRHPYLLWTSLVPHHCASFTIAFMNITHSNTQIVECLHEHTTTHKHKPLCFCFYKHITTSK
jgi:hypothetical protein